MSTSYTLTVTYNVADHRSTWAADTKVGLDEVIKETGGEKYWDGFTESRGGDVEHSFTYSRKAAADAAKKAFVPVSRNRAEWCAFEVTLDTLEA